MPEGQSSDAWNPQLSSLNHNPVQCSVVQCNCASQFRKSVKYKSEVEYKGAIEYISEIEDSSAI